MPYRLGISPPDEYVAFPDFTVGANENFTFVFKVIPSAGNMIFIGGDGQTRLFSVFGKWRWYMQNFVLPNGPLVVPDVLNTVTVSRTGGNTSSITSDVDTGVGGEAGWTNGFTLSTIGRRTSIDGAYNFDGSFESVD